MHPSKRRAIAALAALAVVVVVAVPAFADFSGARTHCDVNDIVPTRVAMGDFNDNGAPGMALTEDDDSGSGVDVSVWFNVDPFDCTQEQTLSLPDDRLPRGGIATGNITGSAGDDVVVVGIDSDNLTSYLWVFANNDDGTFVDGNNADERELTLGDGPTDAATANFNGSTDGREGIAVIDKTSDSMAVFVNDDTDGLTFIDEYSLGSGAQSPVKLTTADVDGDGDPDLLTANQDTDDVSIFLNQGDGTFAEAAESPQTLSSGGGSTDRTPLGITAGDFDGQDGPDAATADSDSDVNEVTVLFNNGTSNGSWDGFAIDDRLPTGSGPESVHAADLDGDGVDDLAAVTGGKITVWDNDSTGVFSEQGAYDPGSWKPREVTGGDVDSDGKVDLITPADMDGKVTVLHNETS